MQYNIPPDTNEKEKIIGGLLDIQQFVYIVIFVVVIMLTLVIFNKLMGAFSLVFGVILGSPALGFAFVKIKGLTLMEYLRRKRKFSKKNKKLPYVVGSKYKGR